MTGSVLASPPDLMTRPHKAHIVLPSPFFAALPFAGRALVFRWRGIETGSKAEESLDSLIS
jgi:hypothetical protein